VGSLGTPEILMILFIALLLFGPKRLPEMGKAVAKMVREFRSATNELKDTLEREVDELKHLEKEAEVAVLGNPDGPSPYLESPPARAESSRTGPPSKPDSCDGMEAEEDSEEKAPEQSE